MCIGCIYTRVFFCLQHAAAPPTLCSKHDSNARMLAYKPLYTLYKSLHKTSISDQIFITERNIWEKNHWSHFIHIDILFLFLRLNAVSLKTLPIPHNCPCVIQNSLLTAHAHCARILLPTWLLSNQIAGFLCQVVVQL